MFKLKKQIEISASHTLKHLPYKSPCKNLHGHNFKITVYCKTGQLKENGMIIDFTEIKRIVNQYDHRDLNDFMEIPTAENFAKKLCHEIPQCYKITVQETEGNEVTYEI